MKENIKTCNVNQSFRCSKEEREFFQNKYPYMMSHFLRHALVKALNDRVFFDYVCFEDDKSTLRY